MDRPIEIAFALIGMTGFCGAASTIEAGVRAAVPDSIDQADAWISIGECLNRIAAARHTVH